ncbi:unnamed protein product [Darwinula stevensoni]|uniref:Fibronectin type-III domain-containing protein n=1 Tax=Darwinula stevensoni TaxID=69355 RepID=A0A7R9ADM1_9CRUS|nr:unnamed protein product [Darwinula stevensoni]CAG0901452.1 unnamed protein product [Darwinula stevensoni]
MILTVPPFELDSWRCWSEQLERLYCTWLTVENPVQTDYSFYVQINGMEMTECQKPNPDATECDLKTDETPPPPPDETGTKVAVDAQNPLGNRSFNYLFDFYRNIKIKALENVAVGEVEAETLDVTWDLPAGLQLYNISIVHNIKWVQSSWADELPFTGMTNYTIPGASNEKSWNYTLTGLIPNTEYEVWIKAVVEDAEFPDLWSSPSTVVARTLPKAPDRSPEVPPGSFHVQQIDDYHRNIHLYWIPLRDWEHYSDNFTYKVEGLEISTQEKVQPTSVTDTSAVFENLNTKSVVRFDIVSKNEKGESPRPSTIEVDEERNRIQSPMIQNEISTDDGKYFFEWRPSEEKKTTNFTVFWCHNSPHWPDCNSVINWIVVPRNITTFELKSEELLKFAVAANGESGGSGMGWERFESSQDPGQSIPVVAVVVPAIIGVILVVSAGLGGKRLWKFIQEEIKIDPKLPSVFSGGNLNGTEERPNEASPYETESVNANTTISGFREIRQKQEDDEEAAWPESQFTLFSPPDWREDVSPPQDNIQFHRSRPEAGSTADAPVSYLQVAFLKEESSSGTKGSILGSPTNRTRSPVQTFRKLSDSLENPGYYIVGEEETGLAPSEKDINYACFDFEDEEKAPEEGHDDGNRIPDSEHVSLNDDAELPKNVGIVQMETRQNAPSTGYVQASVLSNPGASASYLSTNSELEMSLLERDQGHEGESMQAAASCEIHYVEAGDVF